MERINIGCGQTPTAGWKNYDNSLSLRLARVPILPELLHNLRLLETPQYAFIEFCRKNKIAYGDATRGLPLADSSCEVLYSSHMIEHLDRDEVTKFLNEAFRVLVPGGIIRIAAPDINIQVRKYAESGDADAFIHGTRMCEPRPRSFAKRLRLLLVGTRNHQWMYDGNSLSQLLEKHGFVKAEVMPAGKTRIRDHQSLDLQERLSESVYVEAEKPNR